MNGNGNAPLIEIAHCPDIFSDIGIARVEDMGGGLVRLIFAASMEADDGTPQRVIVARIVRTADSWWRCQNMVAEKLLAAGLPPPPLERSKLIAVN